MACIAHQQFSTAAAAAAVQVIHLAALGIEYTHNADPMAVQ